MNERKQSEPCYIKMGVLEEGKDEKAQYKAHQDRVKESKRTGRKSVGRHGHKVTLLKLFRAYRR